MSLKDKYLNKLKNQLDAWSADIDALEVRAREADAELHVLYEAQISMLKTKRDEAQVKLALLRSSAGDAWQELKKGSDEAWESIRHAIVEARRKFGE